MTPELALGLSLLEDEIIDMRAGAVERGVRASRGVMPFEYYLNVWGSEIKARQEQQKALREVQEASRGS